MRYGHFLSGKDSRHLLLKVEGGMPSLTAALDCFICMSSDLIISGLRLYSLLEKLGAEVDLVRGGGGGRRRDFRVG